jgi:hypothetical protein
MPELDRTKCGRIHGALLAAFVVYLAVATVAQAQGLFMREGFEGKDPAKWILLPCYRPENSIARVLFSTPGNFAARLEIRPLSEARGLPRYPSIALDGVSCLGGNDDPARTYIPGGAGNA